MPDDPGPHRELTIRPYQPSDAGAVRRVLTAAFGAASVAALAEELRHSDGHRAALVAEPAEASGGEVALTERAEVIGCVQLTRAWLDAADRLVEVLVLSPLGVLPSMQGRGTGAALVRAAIASAIALRAPCCSWRVRPATTRGSASNRPFRTASSARPCESRNRPSR